jgi:hypothetical protein
MTIRPLRMLALLAAGLALSACATTAAIETRGLPSCSGQDRRPLNAALWAWRETAPLDRASAGGASWRAVFETADAAASKPRWNVAASEKPCR